MEQVATQAISETILLGYTDDHKDQSLLLKRANQHGLIAGATGTGKTVTLMSLAKRFVDQGVTVFAPDAKGDLSNINKIAATRFWDLRGERGETINVAVKDVGVELFSRILSLNETQDGVITIMFLVAKERDLPLVNLEDVRNILNLMIDDAAIICREYGNIDARSIATIQRKILKLKTNGVDDFFGETNFSLNDLFDQNAVVNVLRADYLIDNPMLYSTFLFWLLNELFVKLPEVGNIDKPKLVFFFDEAHLLFADAPKSFVQMIERVVRLIRSKGVGVYFVTQSAADLPDSVLDQLSTFIQHALRGWSPSTQRGLRAAENSFKRNPKIPDIANTILNLGIGEALISKLDERGSQTMVEKVMISAINVPASPTSANVTPKPVRERPNLRVIENPNINKVSEPPVMETSSAHQSTPEPISPQVINGDVVYGNKIIHNYAQTFSHPLETPQWSKKLSKKKFNIVRMTAYSMGFVTMTSLFWGFSVFIT